MDDSRRGGAGEKMRGDDTSHPLEVDRVIVHLVES